MNISPTPYKKVRVTAFYAYLFCMASHAPNNKKAINFDF